VKVAVAATALPVNSLTGYPEVIQLKYWIQRGRKTYVTGRAPGPNAGRCPNRGISRLKCYSAEPQPRWLVDATTETEALTPVPHFDHTRIKRRQERQEA
jgi:hypothetical protein